MLERRRCHPLFIVEQLFRKMFLVAVAVFSFVMSGLEEGDIGMLIADGFFVYVIIGALALIAVFAFFSWLQWRNIWVSAEDNTLIYESGIISKKRVTIPFSKINTIDMGRNLFQRLFGTCRLKVDTGAIDNGTEKKAEMNIVFSLKDAEEFRRYIMNRSAQDEQELRQAGATAISDAGIEPRWAAQARFSDFLMYGLTSSGLWKVFCSLMVAIAFLSELSTDILESAADVIMPYAEDFWSLLSGSGLVLLVLYIIGLTIVLSLISNLLTVVYAAIRYYGFRVAREGGNVVVRYGLISLKNYTIQAENVHAIVVKQNLFQQIIGRCSVEMISIGYGNEENETNLLFPIIQKKKLGWLIETLLPEYSLSVESYKPEKRSIRFMIVRPILWMTAFFAAVLAVLSVLMDSIVIFVIAAVFLLAIIAAEGVLKYRNTALGCDGKVMLARVGGIRCITHLIRVDAVQSIAATSGIFQRPRKVANYQIDFHAPAMRNIALVPHMNDDILQELDSYLK